MKAAQTRWRQPLHVALSTLVVGAFVVFYLVLATVQYQQGSRRMMASVMVALTDSWPLKRS